MAVATTFEDETIAMPKPRQWMLEEPMSSIVLAALESLLGKRVFEQNKKVSELGASLISLHRAAPSWSAECTPWTIVASMRPLLELRPADRLAFGTSCTRCTPAARVCSAKASLSSTRRFPKLGASAVHCSRSSEPTGGACTNVWVESAASIARVWAKRKKN